MTLPLSGFDRAVSFEGRVSILGNFGSRQMLPVRVNVMTVPLSDGSATAQKSLRGSKKIYSLFIEEAAGKGSVDSSSSRAGLAPQHAHFL